MSYVLQNFRYRDKRRKVGYFVSAYLFKNIFLKYYQKSEKYIIKKTDLLIY